MQGKELIFGADCVISLDDLGQLKDYTDTVEDLIAKMKKANGVIDNQLMQQLIEIMQADPEDTFFIPAFKELLKMLTETSWGQLKITPEQLGRIIKFQLIVIEECLLAVTFGEEILQPLIKKCQEYVDLHTFQIALLQVLFKTSDKVNYLEHYEQTAVLWGYLNQETAIKAEKQHEVEVNAAVYLECCEQFCRSRKLRKELKVSTKDKYIIQAKISAFQREKEGIEKNIKCLKNKGFYGSKFLEKMTNMWLQKMN